MRLSLTAEVRQSTFAPPELETLHVDLSRPRQISLGATRAIKRPDEIDFCGMQAGRSRRNLYVPEYRTSMILMLYRLEAEFGSVVPLPAVTTCWRIITMVRSTGYMRRWPGVGLLHGGQVYV